MSRFTPLLCVATAVLLAQPVHAGVIYTWQQVKASPSTESRINLELVFSDAAVASGAVSLKVENYCRFGGSCAPQPNSLLALRFWHERKNADGSFTPMNRIDYGFRDLPRYAIDLIDLDVRFLDGGVLGGTIRANDSNSEFLMSSLGSTFELEHVEGDEGNACGVWWPATCGGEQGVLRASGSVAEVPEPATPALAGLGLLAAWFGRRRRR